MAGLAKGRGKKTLSHYFSFKEGKSCFGVRLTVLFQMTKALVVLEQMHEVSGRSNCVHTVLQHRTFAFKPGDYLSKCRRKTR